MKTYHVALIKDGKTLQIQAEESNDSLSADIIEYLGEYQTTKTRLAANSKKLLAYLKRNRPGTYNCFSGISVL